jgi:hypothetical protein
MTSTDMARTGMTGARWVGGVVASALAITLLAGCGQHAETGSGSGAAVLTPVSSSGSASTAALATSSAAPAVTAPTTAVATTPAATTPAEGTVTPNAAAQSSALNQVNADLGRVDAGTAQTNKDLSAAASAQAQNDQP